VHGALDHLFVSLLSQQFLDPDAEDRERVNDHLRKVTVAAKPPWRQSNVGTFGWAAMQPRTSPRIPLGDIPLSGCQLVQPGEAQREDRD